jgi:dephospho-CoA kinase
MLRLKKGAVTGGLSCGKSSVCRILKELGAYVISADAVVHHLLSSDANLVQSVVKLLGPKILVDNRIDRARVARIVFDNPHLLRALENLLHPLVYNEIETEYQKQQRQLPPPPLFVVEIPLLFESGGEKDYDYTIAVVANPEVCFLRFNQETGQKRKEFENRMAAQLPLLEKAIRAQYVLMNSGSLSNLQDITKELYQELTEE